MTLGDFLAGLAAWAALAVGVDHPHYSATVPTVSDTLRQSLVTDLT